MFTRTIQLASFIKNKSHFLIGPRQTGKSTLLRHLFPEAMYIDLLEADTFRSYAARPEILRQRLTSEHSIIIIDEVQKLPEILDEVQLLIDRNKTLRFILTGSSARKLKRGHANLLGGRAWTSYLFPLVSKELPNFDLQKRLCWGSLPGVILSPSPIEELKGYVGTYLQQEIQAEGLTRSIGAFARFLEFAAMCNGEQINFSSLASDAQLPTRTLRDYFQILEDTQIASLLPVYEKTTKRKPVSTPKFYFFDVGVANFLRNDLSLETDSANLGKRLEHLIFHELRSYLSYEKRASKLCYWRTRTKLEIDFIVGDSLAIEVKAKNNVRLQDLTGLVTIADDCPKMRRIVVCLEALPRMQEGIEFYPVDVFLKKLWAHEFQLI